MVARTLDAVHRAVKARVGEARLATAHCMRGSWST
jgi:hypothetical protein